MVQTPLGTGLGLGTQLHYEAPYESNKYLYASPSTLAQRWPWGSHVAVKKMYQVCSSCDAKHVTGTSNFISYNSRKICSSEKRPEIILDIRKKTIFL